MRAKTFVLAVLALTVLRGVFVSLADLSADEAYFALCARHPAPAYFDGPPGMMALAALGEVALHAPDTLWRLWAPVWGALATFACYLLVRTIDRPGRAAWIALALNALPIFNSAAVRLRPELPALTFVLLGLWFGWEALHRERGVIGRWAGAGVCFALAAQFSYLSLGILPGLALHALCVRNTHAREDGVGLVLLFALPAAGLVPALLWNASLEWIALFPGTFRSFWSFSLAGWIAALARLMDKFSPLLLVLLVVTWAVALRRAGSHPRVQFVALVTLPGVVLAGYLALRGENAVLPLLLAAPLLLFQAVFWAPRRSFGVAAVGSALAVGIVFSASSIWYAYREGTGWALAAAEMKKAFLEESAAGEEGVFLIGGDATIAAAVGYYVRNDLNPPEGHPVVYERESQDISSQFGIWPGYDDFVESESVVDEFFTEQKGENPFVGRSALYLSHEPASDLPQAIKAAFESVALLRELPPAGGGSDPLYLYFCRNYQTPPL